MLDIQSFILALAVGNISFAVLMAGYARGPAANPGLRLWMWARLTLGTCQLLGWLNIHMGMPWGASVGTAGWIAGVAMEVAAYCIFFGFARWQRFVYPTTALALLIIASASILGARLGHVMALLSVMIALFAAGMASILLRPSRKAPLLQRIIGLNDAVFAVAMAMWAWTGVRDSGIDPFASGPVQSVAFLAGYMLMIVNGFGFLLLCKQKDDLTMLRLATVDALTGLLNRQALFDQAEAARRRSERPMALMMLDLDFFKRINDRYGHATGDEALRLFAASAQAVLATRGWRTRATLGRIGGEEFALALTDCTLDGALACAEQLRQGVSAAAQAPGGLPCTMSVSIGVVLLRRDEALAAGLARADQALYDAKRAGRNRVEQGRAALAGAPLQLVEIDAVRDAARSAQEQLRAQQVASARVRPVKRFVEQ